MSKRKERVKRKKEKERAACHVAEEERVSIQDSYAFATIWGSTMYTMGSREDVLEKIRKYTVMSRYGYYVASFDEEKEALEHIKRKIADDSGSRYIILETLKEVGSISPEVEVNEFKVTALIGKE